MKLKQKYEDACNEYVQKFCNKQELTNEGWVNDDVGSIALCSDFYFNLHDIILDINSKQPKGQIIDWYYENLDDPDNFINYHSYIKGLRISDITNNIVGQSEQLHGEQCNNLDTACPKCYSEYLEYKKFHCVNCGSKNICESCKRL